MHPEPPSDDPSPRAGTRRRGPLRRVLLQADAADARMAENGFTVQRSGLFGLTSTYQASPQLREQIAHEAQETQLADTAAHVAAMRRNVRAIHLAATGHDIGEPPETVLPEA